MLRIQTWPRRVSFEAVHMSRVDSMYCIIIMLKDMLSRSCYVIT